MFRAGGLGHTALKNTTEMKETRTEEQIREAKRIAINAYHKEYMRKLRQDPEKREKLNRYKREWLKKKAEERKAMSSKDREEHRKEYNERRRRQYYEKQGRKVPPKRPHNNFLTAEERKAERNRQQAERYANDPEYRQRMLENDRKRREKLKAAKQIVTEVKIVKQKTNKHRNGYRGKDVTADDERYRLTIYKGSKIVLTAFCKSPKRLAFWKKEYGTGYRYELEEIITHGKTKN